MTAKIFTIPFAFAAAVAFAQAPAAQAPAPAGVHSTPKAAAPKIAQKTFDSPDAASEALIDAASKNDTTTLRMILGSSAKGILTSGDPKQDESERQEFAKIAGEKHHLVPSSMNRHVMVLLIGDQDWPFPIPLLEVGKLWRFDPERGAIEVQARRIGENELDAIQACAAYVGVQEAYAAKKRSAAGTQEYARTVSTSVSGNQEIPKEFAEAAGEHPTRPYHGYYFRTLTGQGPNAPGGQHSYIMDKSKNNAGMMGGFALVAYPAQYGVSGVHTFIVNQNGIVYEKDRGAKTAAPVASYDPDPSWTPVD
jgi:Protein of unknown function (DUF2950)